MNGNGNQLVTQDQAMALLRQAIPFAAGVAVAKGWLTTEQATDLMSLILQIAGPLGLVGGAVWTYIANTKKSILLSAGQMPEVQKVVVNDASLAAAVPNDKVDTK